MFLKLTVSEIEFPIVTLASVAPNFFARSNQYEAFNCTEAYEIINGKIGSPIKGATLIGDGPSILKEVSMVGNDMMMDPGIGTCGKGGQGVHVGVAQPSILIDKMTVGGTKL